MILFMFTLIPKISVVLPIQIFAADEDLRPPLIAVAVVLVSRFQALASCSRKPTRTNDHLFGCGRRPRCDLSVHCCEFSGLGIFF